MNVAWLRRAALAVVDGLAWIVPDAERRRWKAQWHADIWYRCEVLARTGLLTPRTALALMGRVSGAFRHAAALRYRSPGGLMLLHDVRHAIRSLKGRPGFTAIAVLTLALGIGANAVIFSWIEATLLDPIPGVRDRGSLAAVYFTTATRNDLSLSYPNYLDLRAAGVPGLADLAIHTAGTLSMRTPEGAERVWGQIVSGNMFEMLGVQPALGRLIGPDDDRVPGGHPVVAVSHAFWQRRLGGRADAVGSTITLNEQPFTVIGVTPPAFHGTQPMVALDVFVPVAMQKAFIPGDRLAARGSGWLQGLARLGPGASLADVQAGLDVAAARLATTYPDVNAGRGLRVFPLWRQPSGGTGMLLPVMAVLGGLVAVLLALVCANMAGLLLARASGRQRELAVRRSLGASRWQVMRLLVTESVVVAMTAGAAATLLARWSGDLFRAFIPPVPLPITIDAGLNPRVLIFSTAISLVAGLALGLVPGVQASGGDMVTPLKDGSAGSGARWRRGRLRQGLIVAQVSLSLVLLVSAGLFLRALDAARLIDPGFSTRRGLVGAIDVGGAGYDEARGVQLFRALAAEVRAVPGVEAAALAQRLPVTFTESSDRGVEVEGYTPAPGEEMSVYYASVTEGFFETIRMPVVEGRGVTARDTSDAPPVMVINETMARRYWPQGGALGGRVRVGDRWVEVVGIAKDAKYGSLTETSRAFMYLPVEQAYRPAMRLVVRTAGDPDALAPAIRAAVRRVDAGLPLFDVQTIEQHLAFSFFLFEMAATLLGVFGITAMLLAALGLYGVVAHSVGQRTREIGVRMSLGATASDVRRMVLRQGLGLALAGVALGVIAAVGVTGLFASQLAGVSPRDPLSFGSTAVLLVATTALACYLPARRAARLNPVQALRTE